MRDGVGQAGKDNEPPLTTNPINFAAYLGLVDPLIMLLRWFWAVCKPSRRFLRSLDIASLKGRTEVLQKFAGDDPTAIRIVLLLAIPTGNDDCVRLLAAADIFKGLPESEFPGVNIPTTARAILDGRWYETGVVPDGGR